MNLLSALILLGSFSLIYVQSCSEDHTSMRCLSSEESQDVIRKRSPRLQYKGNILKRQHHLLSRRSPAHVLDVVNDSSMSNLDDIYDIYWTYDLMIDEVVPYEFKLILAKAATELSTWSVACYATSLDGFHYGLFILSIKDVLWKLLRDLATSLENPTRTRIDAYSRGLNPDGSNRFLNGNYVVTAANNVPELIKNAIQSILGLDQENEEGLAIKAALFDTNRNELGLKFSINRHNLVNVIEQDWDNIQQRCREWPEWDQ